MTITGNMFRQVVRDNKFTASYDLSLNCTTGTAEIGFSGENQKFKFCLTSGKMFDPEGRYFSSYLPNKQFNITTNFSGLSYGYSVNNDNVLISGLKPDFKCEKFYINSTGNTIEASILLKARRPTLNLVTPASFSTGSLITGYFVSDSVGGVKIFTGNFEDSSSFSFYSFPTGVVSASNSGQAVISQNFPVLGGFLSNFSLDTSAGSYSQDFQVSGIESPYLIYTFETVNGSDALNSIANQTLVSGQTKSAGLVLNYGFSSNSASLIPSVLPLEISLSYYSGHTGYYGLVTSIQVNSGGNGYLAAPTVIISGGGGSYASGNALLGSSSTDYDSVIGVQMTNYGSGYTAIPTVIFSGGTGIINNNTPYPASGVALTSFYTKSFTGCYDLISGSNGNTVSYFDNNYLISGNYDKTGISISPNSLVAIGVDYLTTFDSDPLVSKLTISGANSNVITRYITGLK